MAAPKKGRDFLEPCGYLDFLGKLAGSHLHRASGEVHERPWAATYVDKRLALDFAKLP